MIAPARATASISEPNGTAIEVGGGRITVTTGSGMLRRGPNGLEPVPPRTVTRALSYKETVDLEMKVQDALNAQEPFVRPGMTADWTPRTLTLSDGARTRRIETFSMSDAYVGPVAELATFVQGLAQRTLGGAGLD